MKTKFLGKLKKPLFPTILGPFCHFWKKIMFLKNGALTTLRFFKYLPSHKKSGKKLISGY